MFRPHWLVGLLLALVIPTFAVAQTPAQTPAKSPSPLHSLVDCSWDDGVADLIVKINNSKAKKEKVVLKLGYNQFDVGAAKTKDDVAKTVKASFERTPWKLTKFVGVDKPVETETCEVIVKGLMIGPASFETRLIMVKSVGLILSDSKRCLLGEGIPFYTPYILKQVIYELTSKDEEFTMGKNRIKVFDALDSFLEDDIHISSKNNTLIKPGRRKTQKADEVELTYNVEAEIKYTKNQSTISDYSSWCWISWTQQEDGTLKARISHFYSSKYLTDVLDKNEKAYKAHALKGQ